jgi:hypothetical protein
MPIPTATGQSTHLNAQDQPDLIEADSRQKLLKTNSPFRGRAALTLILIDNDHLIGWPALFQCLLSKIVLNGCRFPVIQHLLRHRLAHIHIG